MHAISCLSCLLINPMWIGFIAVILNQRTHAINPGHSSPWPTQTPFSHCLIKCWSPMLCLLHIDFIALFPTPTIVICIHSISRPSTCRLIDTIAIPRLSEMLLVNTANKLISYGAPSSKSSSQQYRQTIPAITFNLEEQNRLSRLQNNQRNDPFHRLPPEIAAQIFALYLDAGSDKSARAAPLILSSVCHAWRNIALSTPHLWKNIHVHLSSESTIKVRIELSRQWLHRSGQLPLSISLSFADTYPIHMVEPLFDLLRAYSDRWRHLTLRIAAVYYRKLVNRRDTLPALEEILLHPPPESIWFAPCTFAVGPTPALRHLAVSNLALAKVPVSWARLTTLSATDVFLADIMSLLRAAPALERVRLARISGSTGIFPLPMATITHRTLRALSVHPDGDVAEKLAMLLECLELPALERLECDFAGSRDALPSEAICALVARSECGLKYFGARFTEPDTRMTDEALLTVLQNMPTLEHLAVFSDCTIPILSDKLFDRLATRFTTQDPELDDVPLPQLKTLEFRGRRTFSWEALAQLCPENVDGATKHINIQMRLLRQSSDPLELVPAIIHEHLLRARMAGLHIDILDRDGTDILID